MSDAWLAPLITALAGLAGGGAGVAYLQRNKTDGEADLAHAEAAAKRATAESVTVATITSALETVQSLSTAKDEQIAAVRREALEDRQKHARDLQDVTQQLTVLREGQKSLASALAAHGQWDLYALSRIRQVDPDFPDPPPLNLDL